MLTSADAKLLYEASQESGVWSLNCMDECIEEGVVNEIARYIWRRPVVVVALRRNNRKVVEGYLNSNGYTFQALTDTVLRVSIPGY